MLKLMRPSTSVVLILAVATVSCGSGSSSQTPLDGESLEGASLTVYSGRSEELVGPLIERFSEETGVDVSIRYAGSAELAATLLAEGETSRADIFFAQDPASLGTIALADMLTELPAEIIGLVDGRFSDGDGRWVGTSGRSRVVVFDASLVAADELPTTEDGFVEPKWRGRVGVAPTNGSFLAFVAAKIMLDGEETTLRWLEGMRANQSPTFSNNSSIVAAVDEGQVEAGLVNHYYLLRRQAELGDVVARNFFFTVPTAGALVMPAGVGILKSASNEVAAEAFVEFLLSTPSQQYFSEETFEYPLVAGVEPSESLPPLESLAAPDLDLSLLATALDQATDLVASAGL